MLGPRTVSHTDLPPSICIRDCDMLANETVRTEGKTEDEDFQTSDLLSCYSWRECADNTAYDRKLAGVESNGPTYPFSNRY